MTDHAGIIVRHSGGMLVLYPVDRFTGKGAISIARDAFPQGGD